ncbi:ABC transporter substrate-binding protein [Rhizobium ruizarguesonis]
MFKIKPAILPLLAAVAPFLLLNFAEARELERSNRLIFNSSLLPGQFNFNWFTPGPKRETGAHQAMWEPLFLIDDRTGLLQPWLGLDIQPNATQNVWTLKLRKGVLWSDSEPFNADDVVFTANLVIDHDELPAAEAANFRAQVSSVRKVDDLTVEFTLRKPNPRFALDNFGGAMFGTFLILPMHIWNGNDPMTFKFDKPIGTGPYTFLRATNEDVVWQRNNDWWGANVTPAFMPLPEPEELIWHHSPDAAASLDAIQKGDIDAGAELSPDDFATLKAANANIIGWDAGGSKGWNDPCARQLEINTDQSRNAPWDNAKLRQALSLLIDRQEIADVAYKGSTIPSRSMFIENGAMRPFIDAIVQDNLGLLPHADIAAAQRLIEAEGYQKGADGFYTRGSSQLSLTIDVNEDLDQDTKSVEVLVQQLKKGGIAARAVPASTAELWGNVVPTGNYGAVYSWLSCGSVAEPWTSMSRYAVDKVAPFGSRSPGFDNTGRWNTPAAEQYSAIVDQIGRMPLQISQSSSSGTSNTIPNPDIPGRVVDAYKYLHDDMPFIPVVQSTKIIPFNTTYWTGWPTSADNYAPPMHSWSRTQLIIHHLHKVN